ncbi:hypothetical protein [Streptomyces sp. NPDC003247]|uniref:hypothetical protein n=1 Tax=Streptomyces sp. NPDC003247 TaxID=3364677 RepID=UPI0036AF5F88
MKPKAQVYSIVVVDIEKFGRRANPVQLWLRERLYDIVRKAFSESGIDAENGPEPSDRGDGFFWLLSGVDRTQLTGRFVDVLDQKLRAHARTSNEQGALRLRVALHQGDVTDDGPGWVGEELNTACRLVDIDPLRTALESGPRAGLALAVSGEWHRQVVRHDDASVAGDTFRCVPFDAKEIRGAHAWIRVPGYDAPPGISGARTAPDTPPPHGPAPGAAPAGGASGGPATGDGGRTAAADGGSTAAGGGSTAAGGGSTGAGGAGARGEGRRGDGAAPAGQGPFAGARFDRVNQVFGGDQIVHGGQTFSWGDGPDEPAARDGEDGNGGA